MKKILAFMLVFAMVFTMTACGRRRAAEKYADEVTKAATEAAEEITKAAAETAKAYTDAILNP